MKHRITGFAFKCRGSAYEKQIKAVLVNRLLNRFEVGIAGQHLKRRDDRIKRRKNA